MKSLTFYLTQMHREFDELIETAKSLRELSKQVVSEEELTAVQKHQQALLEKLEATDEILDRHFWNEMTEHDHQQLRDKVHLFQTLNREFIQNLKANHGLIQFELSHLDLPEELEHPLPSEKKAPRTKSKKIKG